MSPLHAAELDYESLCSRTPGVTRGDVDLDLMRLELIAGACAETAQKAWREYRATGDPGQRREFDCGLLARRLTDAIADTIGFTREAALVLDEMTKARFS